MGLLVIRVVQANRLVHHRRHRNLLPQESFWLSLSTSTTSGKGKEKRKLADGVTLANEKALELGMELYSGKIGYEAALYLDIKWNFLRPAQKAIRGWAYSDLWNLYSHVAELVYPRLRAYVIAYRDGKLAGMYPRMVLAEFKDQLIAEGYQWDEGRWAFKESDADERIKLLWLEILESMLFSFEWVVNGEPIPEDCRKPNPLFSEDGTHSRVNPAYRETVVDQAKYRELEERIQKGFDYFGKYFRCLWD